jgi:hypothetical protein
MSAEEYTRRALELHAEQLALNKKAAKLLSESGRRVRPELNIDSEDLLIKAVRAVHSGNLAASNGIHLDAAGKTVASGPMEDDADITIHNVHELKQRQRFVKSKGCPLTSMSWPMMQQQDTGKYPTLEEHRAGTSPAYTVDQDEFGNLIFKEYHGTDASLPYNTPLGRSSNSAS